MQMKGIYPPLITPLDAQGALDEAGMERLVEHVLSGGVHGLFVTGSCGEGSAATAGLRLQCAKAARRVNAGRLPLLVGVLEQSTGRAIEACQQLEREGFRDFVVTTPYYLRPSGQEQVYRHFCRIAESIEGNLVLYNIPQFTGSKISAETVHALSSVPNIVGVKDSDPDWESAQNILLGGRDADFPYMVGNEDIGAAGLLLGGDGMVPCLANIYPNLFVLLYGAAAQGDTRRAIALQARVTELRNLMKLAGDWVACIKWMAARKGLCQPHVLPPQAALETDTARRLEAALAAFEKTPF